MKNKMGIFNATSLHRGAMICALAVMMSLGFACKEKPRPAAEAAALPENPPPKDVQEVAGIFPGTPLVFIYAPDLSAFVDTAAKSGPVVRYLDSQGARRFRESRLYEKLMIRFNELAGQVRDGLAPRDLTPLAGERSGLALYDIGELKFIYASKVAAGSLASTALWAARDRAEELQVKGTPCYRLGPGESGSVLFFGVAGDWLIVSNMDGSFQDAFARALAGEPSGGGLLDDPVFKTAFPAGLKVHSLLLFLDQGALAEDHYFLRYWIYQNFADIKWMESALIDLNVSGEAWQEERYYVSHDVPASLVDRDLSTCLALVGGHMFNECSAVGDAGQAGSYLGPLLSGDTGGAARLLKPARPEAAGTAVDFKWSSDMFFFGLARSVVIELGKPRGLDLDALRSKIASGMATRAFGPGNGRLEWKKDRYGTSCALPLFAGEAVWADRSGKFLVVSSDGALHKKVLELAGGGKAEAGDVKFTGLSRSSWDAARAGDDFRRATDILGRYDSWPHAESATAAEQDLQGIVDALGPGTFMRQAVRDGGMVRETVVMK